MPCDHKFKSYLNLESIDFEPTTLIVGTFNPAWPAGNTAEWFYGRRSNNSFWNVLPRLHETASLLHATPVEWKQFCRNKQVAITDLISSIGDANNDNPEHIRLLGGYADEDIAEKFFDFELTNIVGLLRRHQTITNVYVTRSISATFWKHKLYPVIRYCNAHDHVKLKPLLTPSGNAYREHGKYNRLHPNARLELPDFILKRWRDEWH